MIVLNFKKWLEDTDITGIPAPVQEPIKLGLKRALPTYEVPVEKYQKKKMNKKAKNKN